LRRGGGLIGVPDAVMLVRVAGEAGNYGSSDRAPTLGSAVSDFFILSHLCRAVGRCAFIRYDSSWWVAGVMDLATSPRFGAPWLGGRWIRILTDGLMRRQVLALPTVCTGVKEGPVL
jgi:hypothetical protein